MWAFFEHAKAEVAQSIGQAKELVGIRDEEAERRRAIIDANLIKEHGGERQRLFNSFKKAMNSLVSATADGMKISDELLDQSALVPSIVALFRHGLRPSTPTLFFTASGTMEVLSRRDFTLDVPDEIKNNQLQTVRDVGWVTAAISSHKLLQLLESVYRSSRITDFYEVWALFRDSEKMDVLIRLVLPMEMFEFDITLKSTLDVKDVEETIAAQVALPRKSREKSEDSPKKTAPSASSNDVVDKTSSATTATPSATTSATAAAPSLSAVEVASPGSKKVAPKKNKKRRYVRVAEIDDDSPVDKHVSDETKEKLAKEREEERAKLDKQAEELLKKYEEANSQIEPQKAKEEPVAVDDHATPEPPKVKEEPKVDVVPVSAPLNPEPQQLVVVPPAASASLSEPERESKKVENGEVLDKTPLAIIEHGESDETTQLKEQAEVEATVPTEELKSVPTDESPEREVDEQQEKTVSEDSTDREEKKDNKSVVPEVSEETVQQTESKASESVVDPRSLVPRNPFLDDFEDEPSTEEANGDVTDAQPVLREEKVDDKTALQPVVSEDKVEEKKVDVHPEKKQKEADGDLDDFVMVDEPTDVPTYTRKLANPLPRNVIKVLGWHSPGFVRYLEFTFSDGGIASAGKGGKGEKVEYYLEDNEYIVEMAGCRYNHSMSFFEMKTNLGHIIGPFGTPADVNFVERAASDQYLHDVKLVPSKLFGYSSAPKDVQPTWKFIPE